MLFPLRGSHMDSMNEAGVSSTIGTAISGVVTNDGSCIPLRKLGSFEIPAIVTGKSAIS